MSFRYFLQHMRINIYTLQEAALKVNYVDDNVRDQTLLYITI